MKAVYTRPGKKHAKLTRKRKNRMTKGSLGESYRLSLKEKEGKLLAIRMTTSDPKRKRKERGLIRFAS